MLAPISFERVEKALSTPSGWVELALVLLCFAAGWAVDRAIVARKREGVVPSELAKGAFRIVMPVVALVLLFSGVALMRVEGFELKNPNLRSWTYWAHVITPFADVGRNG